MLERVVGVFELELLELEVVDVVLELVVLNEVEDEVDTMIVIVIALLVLLADHVDKG